jgi:hypothetical protein
VGRAAGPLGRRTGYQRLAYLVALVLIAAGLAHAAAWAVAGGSAAGPLSWRKPVTFGVSFGLTTLTLGWVAAWLPVRRATGWAASILLCTSTSLEVAWVSLQHARGVPSHFNDQAALDNGLFLLGGAAIAVTVVVVAAMTVAAFRSRPVSASARKALAASSGASDWRSRSAAWSRLRSELDSWISALRRRCAPGQRSGR